MRRLFEKRKDSFCLTGDIRSDNRNLCVYYSKNTHLYGYPVHPDLYRICHFQKGIRLQRSLPHDVLQIFKNKKDPDTFDVDQHGNRTLDGDGDHSDDHIGQP